MSTEIKTIKEVCLPIRKVNGLKNQRNRGRKEGYRNRRWKEVGEMSSIEFKTLTLIDFRDVLELKFKR